MLDKLSEEKNCDFDLIVAWCINGKNSLSSVHFLSLTS